ncbi:hypothetical protein CLV30_11771 [Haloactinopolyspora alba]|uniref:Uncharacterized protein n=1 Tax=Haloactinopolyspora alba TaxID=648780 RepID=A0A2P8DRC5_9ACTN|nr:hypothetical protein [Haloactinopolyspora alba]PSK99768.1 hypothetical protein CLV30_11771 [Haloactinopolyspora alba]
MSAPTATTPADAVEEAFRRLDDASDALVRLRRALATVRELVDEGGDEQ